jgi:hypothetical protein
MTLNSSLRTATGGGGKDHSSSVVVASVSSDTVVVVSSEASVDFVSLEHPATAAVTITTATTALATLRQFFFIVPSVKVIFVTFQR